MEKVSKIDDRLRPFIQAMPDIFNYQIVTKVALAVLLLLFGRIFQVLLKSGGRVAITSGDFTFLFTTWQGWLKMVSSQTMCLRP